MLLRENASKLQNTTVVLAAKRLEPDDPVVNAVSGPLKDAPAPDQEAYYKAAGEQQQGH